MTEPVIGSTSREVILDRVRRAAAVKPVAVEVPRDYHGAGALAGTDLVALLVDRIADYQARVQICRADAGPEAITTALARRSARRVITPAGLPTRWRDAVPEPLDDDPPRSIAELDAVDGVLTSVALAIASTGTLVLDATAGQGRRILTLLPDYHLAIVEAAQIVATVPDALAALDPVRPLTWISGPSATSDIELNRVEGVHGPRNLEVIVVV
jgi:L-lactate dehydrogenase complex protein LldG